MARERLSAAGVKALKEPGRYADGDGLYLFIDKKGNKRWIYRFTMGGRTSERGLGSANVFTLAQARERAAEERRLHKSGTNPVAAEMARKAVIAESMPATESRTPTFGKVADEFVAVKVREFKNDKHIAQWQTSLKNACEPIRSMPVDEIKVADVMRVLEPIWSTTPETASRLRGRIEMVLDAARVRGFIDETRANPARWSGNLSLLLPAQRAIDRGHHAALPYEHTPAFMARLRGIGSISSLALEFTILTAARTSEVTGMTWAEVDMAKSLWTVPAKRMKAGRVHRVPLSPPAIEILSQMKEGRISDHVFPGRDGGGLSDRTMDAVLRGMGLNGRATIHGFRSTFRDWAGDMTAHPREVAEAALAHALGDKTEAAYRRKDALDKRRLLMDEWATFCATENVAG